MFEKPQKEVSYTVYENSTPGGFILTQGKVVIPTNQDAQRHVEAMFPGRGVTTLVTKYL